MAASPLYDTHAHLDDESFADLPEVLARAAAVGLVRVNTIGIDAATSRAAVALADKHALLSAVVGIQPNCVAEVRPGDWDTVLELASRPSVVAIGETGLDRYWDRAPFDQQEDWFDRHLDLARSHGLPVVIHCREAEGDVVRTLRSHFEKHGPILGVMHSFTGDRSTAEACLAMGLHISFAGMVTYKKNTVLREVAASVPLDRLLIETDAPYLAPEPVRGKRCEPAFIAHTAACVAGARGMSTDVLATATTANARTLFHRAASSAL